MTNEDNGWNDVEMLKKAVSLSQANLAELRDGDILNFKEDLWDLTGRGYSMDETKEGFVKRLTLDQLKKIQAEFSRCFAELADGGTDVAWKTEGPKMFFVAWTDSRSKTFNYSMYSPDPIEQTAVSLIQLLVRSRATPEQFRRCPECQTIFFLGRKPDKRNFYCSQRCAVRVAVRNSRKREEEKERKKKHGKRKT
jgi:hypothetical protein